MRWRSTSPVNTLAPPTVKLTCQVSRDSCIRSGSSVCWEMFSVLGQKQYIQQVSFFLFESEFWVFLIHLSAIASNDVSRSTWWSFAKLIWNERSKFSKIPNTRCLPKNPRQTAQTQIRIFPVCYSDKRFHFSSRDKRNFYLRREKVKCLEF